MQHIGFSTGWGSVGEFKIWRKEDSDDDHNEAFTLGVPHNMVPGSERASAFMIGMVVYGWRHTQCLSEVFIHLKLFIFSKYSVRISCDSKNFIPLVIDTSLEVNIWLFSDIKLTSRLGL